MLVDNPETELRRSPVNRKRLKEAPHALGCNIEPIPNPANSTPSRFVQNLLSIVASAIANSSETELQ